MGARRGGTDLTQIRRQRQARTIAHVWKLPGLNARPPRHKLTRNNKEGSMRVLLASVALAAAFASAAFAGERVVKEIQQNDKVRVYEATYQPGDTSPMAKRSGTRVVYVI